MYMITSDNPVTVGLVVNSKPNFFKRFVLKYFFNITYQSLS